MQPPNGWYFRGILITDLIHVDEIDELTPDEGVTVEGVIIKDGVVYSTWTPTLNDTPPSFGSAVGPVTQNCVVFGNAGALGTAVQCQVDIGGGYVTVQTILPSMPYNFPVKAGASYNFRERCSASSCRSRSRPRWSGDLASSAPQGARRAIPLPCFQREAADYSGSAAFRRKRFQKHEAGGGSVLDRVVGGVRLIVNTIAPVLLGQACAAVANLIACSGGSHAS